MAVVGGFLSRILRDTKGMICCCQNIIGLGGLAMKTGKWKRITGKVPLGMAVLVVAAVIIVAPMDVHAISFFGARTFNAGTNPYDVITGDFNGDGKADLAVANDIDNNISVLINKGDGTFKATVNYVAGNRPSSVTKGDFNGDGKADLAAANYNSGTISVFLGNGDGSFAAAVNYSGGATPIFVTTGDFNGDGKIDLITASAGSNYVSVIINNGDGTFIAPVNYPVGAIPNSIAVGDFNNDGTQDLAVLNGGAPYNVSVLLGNGDGTFRATVNYSVGAGPREIITADLNGDGKLDLAVANYSNNNVSVLIGNGDGTFQARVNYSAGTYPRSLSSVDLNGDGKLDLAVANYGSNNVSVLLGNGNGTFQAPVNYSAGRYPQSITAADFSGDGQPDLAVISSGNICVLLGNGDGTFRVTQNYEAGASVSFVTATDFNRDGITDLAVVNPGSGEGISVLLGNGDGSFRTPVSYGTGTNPYSAATGDFNADGNPDLAIANYGSHDVSVLLGNGDGTFQPAVNYGNASYPSSVSTSDLNGDGKLDLAIANYGSHTVSIRLGNGDGTFQPAVNYAAGLCAYAVTIADLNGDGRPDLGVANACSNNVSVLLGNGDGTFQTKVDYAAGSFPNSVTAADFNGDGKTDLGVANYSGNNVSVLLGNGNGTFQVAVNYSAGVNPYRVTSVDIDEDGNYDLVVANFNGSVSVIMSKDDGTFQPAVDYSATNPYSVTAADFNGDGKIDLAVANAFTKNISILLNTMLRVKPSAGQNGNLVCTPALVDPKKDASCAITPYAGYMISDVLVNGASIGPASSYNFTNITTDQTINATFVALQYQLGVSVVGLGTVTSNPAGIDCGFSCSVSFAPGTPVSLTATPGMGQVFTGWSGACSGIGTCSVTLTQAKSVTATFSPITWPMSISVTGSGTVHTSPGADLACSANCGTSYNDGAVVTLTPIPNAGQVFTGWGGACSGTGVCSVTMSAARSVTATFVVSGGTCSAPARIIVPEKAYSGSYTITWGASPTSGVTYVLEESANSGPWTQVYTGTALSYTVSGRLAGTYAYRVAARKSGYADSAWVVSSPVPVILACSAPSWITAPDINLTGIYSISWTTSPTSGATFELEESVNGGAWTQIYAGTAISKSFTGKANGTYQYRVKAVKPDYTDSPWKTSVVTTVNLTCSAPGQINAPGNSNTGTYSISWGTSPTSGATFVLEESVNGGAWTQIYAGTAISKSLTGKANGTYQYRVKAVKPDYSDSSWKTSAVTTVNLICSAPFRINAPALSYTGSYSITWDASSTSGVTYVLEESANSEAWTQVYSGTGTTKNYTGKANGTYQYRVKAVKTDFSDSPWTTSAVATVTLTCSMPVQITAPATASTGAYSVSWSASGTSGVTYVLEESVNSGTWTQVASGSVLSKGFTGKTSGTYQYRVKSVKTGYDDSAWNTSTLVTVP